MIDWKMSECFAEVFDILAEFPLICARVVVVTNQARV